MRLQKRKAVRLVAYLNDFDGAVNRWRESFYEIWRYQMTWDFAYRIELNESRKAGVFVIIDVKNGYRQNALEMLENLGYRKVKQSDVTAGIFETLDLDPDIDLVAED